jgi:hypothetical protein
MGKDKEFENILNECLDRLMAGETIESCLARYPQHAAELEPLLKTALETRTAASVSPAPEFRQRAGIEFQKAIAEMPAKAPKQPFRWQLRWVLPVVAFLVVFASGVGTVISATNSLPGSPLYGLKLTVERVQLAFTFSSEGKAELYSRFVDYRVEEIAKMAEEGNYDQVKQATEQMNGQLLAMADLNIGGVNASDEKAIFGMQSAEESLHVPAATTPAPTTTTPAETVTPTITTASPATDEPPVAVTQPAPTITVVLSQPPSPERIGGDAEDTGELSELEQLRQLLTTRYEQNLQILLEQLEKAPEALKPAIQEAIEVLQRGYELALASLG